VAIAMFRSNFYNLKRDRGKKKLKKPRKFWVILEQKRGKIEKDMAISWLDSKRGRVAMF
jgi:hypothetical protein